MKKVAFTICAKNYLGLAQLLEKTIAQHNNDVDFYIFVADEFDKSQQLPDNVFIAKHKLNISSDLWNEMAFKYDLTEFCTAIKPFCFSYLFSLYDDPIKCLYFDPDIAVFNSLSSLYETLESSSICLTPHITTIERNYSGPLNENKLLYSGVFNLGFIGMRSDDISKNVVLWWQERLMNYCFKSQNENYFTDQKWIDFLPAICPVGLYISFDLGNNVAPWNFYERKVIVKNNKYFVSNRLKEDEEENLTPINFVHFSGYNYSSMMYGEFLQNNIQNFKHQDDILLLLEEYKKLLKESSFNNFLDLEYTYNFFKNGKIIQEVHRRLYRRLVEDFKYSHNPFITNGMFYKQLKASSLILENTMKFDVKALASNDNFLLKISAYLFKFSFKLLGPQKYFLLLKLLRRYSILENQLFLLDKEYLKSIDLRK